MKRLLLIIAIVSLAVTPASAAFFQNGSFESGINPPGSGFTTLYGGSTAITGWTVWGHSIDWIGNYWQPAASSNRSIDLNGNGRAWIWQRFDTTPGMVYRVSFDMAGNPDGGDESKDLRVSAGNYTGLFNFNTNGTSLANMGWVTKEFFFTASELQTTLIFASRENGSYGPAIDNVDVSAVPLPPALILLFTGLMGLIGVRRTMRK
jgi:choice-of-anchor C domain-containing protein